MIYSIGEALIDIFKQNDTCIELVGGSSCNLCATVAKLGGVSSIITKLGMDGEANDITKALKKAGVDISNISYDTSRPTGKVFISALNKGSNLCSKRKHCADYYINESDIEDIVFKDKDILHFSSFSLVESPAKYAVIKAINCLNSVGGSVAFDINLRIRQWNSIEECLCEINKIMPFVDYLKISYEELIINYPNMSTEKVIGNFFDTYLRLQLVIITDGEKGSSIYFRDKSTMHITPDITTAVDTTGAGDCFYGAFLYSICEVSKNVLSKQDYKNALAFATTAAMVSTQTLGAIEGLPTLEDIKKRLRAAKPNCS